MAGCQARSFAPWVGALAASLDAAAAQGAPAPAAPLQVAVLNAELQGVGLAKAAHQGLPAPWVTRLTLLDPHRRQVPPRHPGRRLTAIEPPARRRSPAALEHPPGAGSLRKAQPCCRCRLCARPAARRAHAHAGAVIGIYVPGCRLDWT